MDEPKQTGTNAADSAPGVGDGPALGAPPNHRSKPGGRGLVWLGIGVVILVLIVIVASKPLSSRGPFIEPGVTSSDIARSHAPGAPAQSQPGPRASR